MEFMAILVPKLLTKQALESFVMVINNFLDSCSNLRDTLCMKLKM